MDEVKQTTDKDYKTLCFVLLTDMANDNDVDISELFERYGFDAKDIEDYHKWF
jgi:hypothetical protein